MHPRERTGKPIHSIRRTNPSHISKHPIQHRDLREARCEGRRHLYAKEQARRDLHVVPELEVGGELDALCGADVAVGHEDHVCDGAAGEERAACELVDEVGGGVLVGYGGDDAGGDEEEGAQAEGEEEAVPGEVNGVAG
ncbi:hypothetical protein V494_00143 [Pseudogymnoascus sp. VKM F-4513 (FW-928)]|nr:hypothetical protein V494_00143 [Pseudogymnoascus sp. VKM F-4513 (FW-928)]